MQTSYAQPAGTHGDCQRALTWIPYRRIIVFQAPQVSPVPLVLWVLALASGLWFVLAVPAVAACDSSVLDPAVIKVNEARAELRTLPVDDDAPTAVAPEVQAAIAAMKERLGELLDAYMQCAPEDLDPARVASELMTALATSEPAAEASVHYGDRLVFAAQRPGNQPRLLAVTAEFAIPCGTDTVLFIFEPDGGRWREVLRWQSHPYGEISGAFASFGYAISPSDGAGRWFLATKTVAPWCSSTWSIIRYAILRPRPDRLMPRILYAAEDPIWWGSDDFGQLSVGKNDVDLRFHADSIDLDIHNRLWVRHFSVTGDVVRRIPPIALSPRDFVDEWVAAD